MNQVNLFDHAESERRRVEGMTLAADNRGMLLTEAREIAKELAKDGRAISADDVMEIMVKRGYGKHCLGPAAGSLFAGHQWKWTGHRVKSQRPWSHQNELKTWIYVN